MTDSVSHQLSIRRKKKKKISDSNTLACEQPPPALEKQYQFSKPVNKFCRHSPGRTSDFDKFNACLC